VLSIDEALDLADKQKLDLVNISPNAKPPVCRIMSYGKYKYELTKKEKESKKKQKVINVKEIRLTPNIEDHDLSVKAKNATKFLKDGNRVKVSVRFRGREMGYSQIGRDVLKKFAEITSEVSTIDKMPKIEGRNMIMFLNPKN
jgi:translation initiation factor IF-3